MIGHTRYACGVVFAALALVILASSGSVRSTILTSARRSAPSDLPPPPIIKPSFIVAASPMQSAAPLASSTNRGYVGTLDHVSIAWIEGYACNTDNFSSAVTVEVYATGTSGDGTRIQYNGDDLYRIATGVANENEPGRASACGGNKSKGFHIPLPDSMLDRQDHTIVTFAKDTTSGSDTLLSGATVFNSRVLYSQEPIYNIDDHILVNSALVNSPIAQAESNFYASNHTLVVVFPPAGTNPFSTPIACDVSWATGFAVSEPFANETRGLPSHIACPSKQSPVMAAVADGDQLGFIDDSADFGRYDAGVFIQDNLDPAQRVFRPGFDGDTLRVSGVFRQPQKFPDPTTSPDAMNFWYYVLIFKGPAGNLWFMVPTYYSRVAGSDTWKRFSDGVSDFTFEGGGDIYVNTPLKLDATWITPCRETSYFGRDSYPGEKMFCFELSAAQLRAVLQNYASTHAVTDTDPSHYLLQSFLVNSEAWGIGGPNRIALSMHNLRVESIFAP